MLPKNPEKKNNEMRSCSLKVEKTFPSSKTHFPNHMFVTAIFFGVTFGSPEKEWCYNNTLCRTNISKHPRLVGFITGIPAKIRVWKLRQSCDVGFFFIGKNDVRRKT